MRVGTFSIMRVVILHDRLLPPSRRGARHKASGSVAVSKGLAAAR